MAHLAATLTHIGTIRGCCVTLQAYYPSSRLQASVLVISESSQELRQPKKTNNRKTTKTEVPICQSCFYKKLVDLNYFKIHVICQSVFVM